MRWDKLVVCQHHPKNDSNGSGGFVINGRCLSCEFAIKWNLHNRFCDCGEPAVGYVARSKDDVDFFCEEHYDAGRAAISEVKG